MIKFLKKMKKINKEDIKNFFKGILWTILFSFIYFIVILLLVPFFGFYVIFLLWFPFIILSFILPFSGEFIFPLSIILFLIIGGIINIFFKRRKKEVLGIKK